MEARTGESSGGPERNNNNVFVVLGECGSMDNNKK